MNIYISHSSKYDYINNLYTPIKKCKLYENHQFYFPHETDKVINTKHIITNYDLLIAEISLPSISQGIELGWADYANVPILFIYTQGTTVSSSLKLVTNHFFEYKNTVDMINKIDNFLKQNYIV